MKEDFFEMLKKKEEKKWDVVVGNGNFLIEILKRKLNLGHDPLKALNTIYGADIMEDNIRECRARLLKVIVEHVNINKINKKKFNKILKKNIVCTPLSKYPKGALDYDFSFND